MRFAVLVSGGGTNLPALIDAQTAGSLAPAEIACVVSNVAGAGALERARNANIDHAVVPHRDFDTREAFEQALGRILKENRCEAIVLAGFMRILTPAFVAGFEHRIINTHPALCPSFPGIHAPQQAVDYGVRVTGCTVHFVDSGVDTGPIIFQRAVEVREEDDASSLHERIRACEHELLPRAVHLLAAGRLHVEGRRVKIRTPDA